MGADVKVVVVVGGGADVKVAAVVGGGGSMY